MSTLRICIVSWDDEAKKLYSLLNGFHRIDYIIERDHNLWGTLPDGTHIVSFSKAYALFRENKFDVFLIPAMRGINVKTGIFMRLKRGGVPAEKIWYAPLAVFKDKNLNDTEKRSLICPFEERRELDYVALHIADHCNLNCAYCSVFCGLVKEPSLPDKERTFEGISLLRKYFEQVLVFRVLGGEPLLNPDWLEICLYIRKLYPWADVEVVTNGIKILQIPDEQLEIMRENNIAFDVSYYPAAGGKIDEIHERLEKAHVIHYITQENEFFSRLYSFSHPGDEKHNYDVCKMKFMCLNMYEKFLCVCHALIGLERAEGLIDPETAGTVKDYRVDLSQPGLSAAVIQEMLDRPMPICRYCNQELAPWHVLPKNTNTPDPADWSIL